MKIVYAIILMVVLVAVFIVTYILNKNTKKPEGCEEWNEHCMHCSITSCLHNANKEEKKDV